MTQTNDELLIAETDEFLREAEASQADAENALPFETLDEYLGDPTGFADVTAKLFNKVKAVFDLAGKYNRHSSEYLKSLSQLEKGIKYLGVSCLQKFALEKENHVFPELAQLNTTNLYTMAVLHFNKIDKALSEYMAEKGAMNDGLLDMEYRYYNLMERIRSTEVKINNYNYKSFSRPEDYNRVIRGLAFSDESWSKSQHKHDEPMPFRNAPAFSMSKEYEVRSKTLPNEEGRRKNEEDGTNQKSEIRNQKSDENEEVVPADVQESENGNEASVSDDQLSISHREQFSKKGSTRRVAEEIAENEEDGENQKSEIRNQKSDENEDRRMKNEEMAAENEEVILPAEEEVPQCVRILQNAVIRSRLHNLDYLGFTEGETRLLTADPLFAQLQPQMAADMKQALLEHDSG